MINYWNRMDRLNLRRATKYELTIWLLVLGGGILGAAAGSLFVCSFSLGWEWCVIPALACSELTIPALFLYACRHDFHQGSFRQNENPDSGR